MKLKVLAERLVRDSHPIPPILVKLVQRFSEDSSQEVQSYVPDLTRNVLTHSSDHGELSPSSPSTRPWAAEASTFSRPPPPRIRQSVEFEGPDSPLSDLEPGQR
jgi:serine/threonine-protein phosphatase 4 regulatory subunit 1